MPEIRALGGTLTYIYVSYKGARQKNQGLTSGRKLKRTGLRSGLPKRKPSSSSGYANDGCPSSKLRTPAALPQYAFDWREAYGPEDARLLSDYLAKDQGRRHRRLLVCVGKLARHEPNQ